MSYSGRFLVLSYSGRFLVLSYSGRFLVFELQWTLFGSNRKASSTQHSLRQNRLLPLYYSGRSGRFWTLWTLFGDAELSLFIVLRSFTLQQFSLALW